MQIINALAAAVLVTAMIATPVAKVGLAKDQPAGEGQKCGGNGQFGPIPESYEFLTCIITSDIVGARGICVPEPANKCQKCAGDGQFGHIRECKSGLTCQVLSQIFGARGVYI
ncbi:hypothetical protein BDK51DRAFT_33265, partial [Blyttiomyces helicus]